MKKKTKPTGPKPDVEIVAITNLSQLEQLCGEQLKVSIQFAGKNLEITGRRLKPVETRDVEMLLNRALPPKVVDKEGEPPRYDFDAPDFVKNREVFRRQARALAVWRGFPLFAQMAEELQRGGSFPFPKTVEEITEFVEGRQVEDDMLDRLFAALSERVVSQEAWMGFSFGNSSPKS